MFKIGDRVYIKQSETQTYKGPCVFRLITKIENENVTLILAINERMTLQKHIEILEYHKIDKNEIVININNIEFAKRYPYSFESNEKFRNTLTNQIGTIIKPHFRMSNMFYIDYGDDWEIIDESFLEKLTEPYETF